MGPLKAYDVGFEAGFKAGWSASGEGYNGEYPDEGVPWPESAGRQAYLQRIGEKES